MWVVSQIGARETTDAVPSHEHAQLKNNTNALTQYIIDCTSLNLENDFRVSLNDPMMTEIYLTARHMVNAIHHSRTRQLKALSKKTI